MAYFEDPAVNKYLEPKNILEFTNGTTSQHSIWAGDSVTSVIRIISGKNITLNWVNPLNSRTVNSLLIF